MTTAHEQQPLAHLDDWEQSQPNKLASGTDVLGGRPTVLWALALEGLGESDQRRLISLLDGQRDEATLAAAGEFYRNAGAFRKAAALISKHHQRARVAADQFPSDPLRRLLHFLADAILDRRPLEVEGQ